MVVLGIVLDTLFSLSIERKHSTLLDLRIHKMFIKALAHTRPRGTAG